MKLFGVRLMNYKPFTTNCDYYFWLSQENSTEYMAERTVQYKQALSWYRKHGGKL